MDKKKPNLRPRERDAILQSLRAGVTPRTGLQHIQVGRVKESDEAYTQDFVTVDDWLYNLGPDRLVRIVTFEKGKVVGMRAYSYGRLNVDEPDINRTVEIGDP